MLTKLSNWKIWTSHNTLGLTLRQIADLALKKNSTQSVNSSSYANVFIYDHNFDNKNVKLYIKHFLDRSHIDAVKHILRASRAKRAAGGNMLLKKNGFCAAENIAWGHQKNFPFKRNCFLITKEITDAKPLTQFIGQFQGDEQEVNVFIKQLAGTVGRMHRMNIYHGDMRAGNILIKQGSGRFEFYFLDNERTRKFPYLPESLRIKNLVQLNMLISDRIQLPQRQHFFSEYITVSGYKDVKSLMEKVLSKTHQRLQRLVDLGRITEKDVPV